MKRSTNFYVKLGLISLFSLNGLQSGNSKILALECSNKNLDNYQEVIEGFLFDTLYNSIFEKHGYSDDIAYWNFKLLNIQKIPNSDSYQITVSFDTFHGSHNPPFHHNTVIYEMIQHPLTLKEIEFEKKLVNPTN